VVLVEIVQRIVVVKFMLPLPFNRTSQLLHLPWRQPYGIVTPAFFDTSAIRAPCSLMMDLPEGSKLTVTGFTADNVFILWFKFF
jgi:hypothetical protein